MNNRPRQPQTQPAGKLRSYRQLASIAAASTVLMAVWTPAPTRAQSREIADDVQDLVFLGPAEPLKLRIHVLTDGEGFRGLRRSRLDHMFAEVDKDNSGLIETAERSHLPTPEQLASGQNVQTPQFGEFDTDPPDGNLSRAEFDRYVSRMMGVMFHVQEPPARATQEIDLFGILDADQDGRIRPADAATVSQRLRRLDFDNDESYSAAEIGPFQDPFGAGRVRRRKINSGDTPFRVVPDVGSLQPLAEEIRDRYAEIKTDGAPSRDAEPNASTPADGAPSRQAEQSKYRRRLDRNRDGRVVTEEIVAWLEQGPPQLEVFAELPNPTTHRARIKVRPVDESVVENMETASTREVSFEMGNQVFEARVLLSRSAIADNRGLFRIRFLMSDSDKNGYLDETEFFGLQVPGAGFGTVDRNGDGMLFVEEVVEYVDQEAMASRSRAVMTVEREGQALFEVFDTDSNGRLTPRELSDAPGVLLSLDRTGDGVINEGELVGQYRLRFELGKPAVFDEPPRTMSAAAMGTAMNGAGRSSDGPVWFQRMDRNGDGDVTRREFLGTREMFDKLDGDGDGLMTAEEAASAGELAN